MDFIFIIEIALFIILMGMSGFFSSSETALFSLDSFHLEQMKKDKNTNIGLIEKLLAQPRRLSAGAVVAIVVGEFAVQKEGTEIKENNLLLRVHRSSAKAVLDVRINW